MSQEALADLAPSRRRAALAAVLPPFVLALVVLSGLWIFHALPALALTLGRNPVPTVAGSIEFDNLRQAEKELGVELRLPTYLPDDLRWPPTTVRGTLAGDLTISYLLLSADSSRSLLVGARFAGQQSACLAAVVEVGAGRGCLESGGMPTGRVTSRLEWTAGDRIIELQGTYPADELLRIARSFPAPD